MDDETLYDGLQFHDTTVDNSIRRAVVNIDGEEYEIPFMDRVVSMLVTSTSSTK